MAKRYYYKTSDGVSIIPVSDGVFHTDNLSVSEAESEFYIEFYSDDAASIPVTPTGGTITVSGSPLGNAYLSDSATTTINAADVGIPAASYTPPIFDGLIMKSKIELSGITGATHCVAVLFKH